MDRMVYTALSGMRSTQFAQTVTANNLANANTTGFRRDVSAFQTVFMQGEQNSRALATNAVLSAELDAGQLVQTGRNLDVAVSGKSFIAVQSPDGGEAYTRRGDLQISATGVLETGDGFPVLGANGAPLTIPPASRVEIGDNGIISIQPEGGQPIDMIEIGRIKLATPDPAQLRKGDDGLFRLEDGAIAAADPGATLKVGSLEQSNVNTMASMVELIEQSRSYELQVKMLSTAKELDQSSTALLRIDG